MRSPTPLRILIFSKTAGYRHESIPAGIQGLRRLGLPSTPSACDASEDATIINEQSLAQYSAVVFLHTSGNFLDEAQLNALRGYMRSGGGFVGIHCAAAGLPDDPWYCALVGSAFTDHPEPQDCEIKIEEPQHVLTKGFSTPWKWHDEWYNFRSNPRADVTVLMSVNESTYRGGTMGEDHPLAWCQEFDGGRSFYTSLGHFDEAWSDKTFCEHIRRGILWAAGKL